MRIWQQPLSVDILNAINEDTVVRRLGIEFLEVGDDFLRARVPVNAHTRQPYAVYACPEGWRAVGLDINANHIRGATSGWVTGTARPVHIGRSTQVWQIDMHNDAGELTCVSRLTMAVLGPRPEKH
jgi:1,4-dihydroxy-2-naphthoyl-CoA hydrolase